jgi:hypothetical protein
MTTKSVELESGCFGTYGLAEATCQGCPIRVDCKAFQGYKCSHKLVYVEAECGECIWRAFCRRKSFGQNTIRKRPSGSSTAVGVDPVSPEEYNKENERCKEELRSARDVW